MLARVNFSIMGCEMMYKKKTVAAACPSLEVSTIKFRTKTSVKA